MADEKIELKVVAKQEGVKETDKAVEHLGDTAEKATEQTNEFSEQLDELNERFSETKPEAESASKSIDESGKSANKASSFFKKLGMSLKRIFLYRTIRKVLSEIGQAAREGVSNLYGYSAALGSMDSTHAKTNLDDLATSALYVKNSIGAMLSPVIQAITPIVYQMADAFALAANAVNQLFAAIVGNSTFTKAVRFPTEMQSGLSGASKAAKELRRTLLGFDEVNRLDMETPSGGGGGASGLNTEGMFDEADVAPKFQKIAKILKDIVPIVKAIGVAFAAWKVISTIVNVVKAIGTAIGLINAPVLAVVAAVGLVVAAFVKAYKSNENFRKGVDAMWAAVKVIFNALKQIVKDVGVLIKALIPSSVIKAFKNWADVVLNAIPGINLIYKALKSLGAMLSSNKISVEQWALYLEGAVGKVRKGFINGLVKVEAAINDFLKPLKNLAKVIDAIFGTNYAVKFELTGASQLNALANQTGGGYTHATAGSKVVVSRVQQRASGGFVSTGDLFIARENGIPEMVGKIGNQTAVANNDQIVSAIKQGVVEAMSQSGQNISVNVDGKSLFDIVVNRNNSQVRTTGKSPILV